MQMYIISSSQYNSKIDERIWNKLILNSFKILKFKLLVNLSLLLTHILSQLDNIPRTVIIKHTIELKSSDQDSIYP